MFASAFMKYKKVGTDMKNCLEFFPNYGKVNPFFFFRVLFHLIFLIHRTAGEGRG